MVVKRRLLLAIASALTLVMTAAAPMMAASYKEAMPRPLRQAGLLRVKDIAANGGTRAGAVVAVGWHESSDPGQLYLAFSLNGGRDYRRTNGKLRQYRVVGDPKLGVSLAVCGGRVWAGSTYREPSGGGSRVFMTSRTVGGGAAQAFLTPSDGRSVRDVSVACAGKDLLAIGWLEKKAGKYRARLVLRSMEPLGKVTAIQKKYKLGAADYKGGLAVAATPEAALVAYVRDGDLRVKRYAIDADDPSLIKPGPSNLVAQSDIKGPQMAARGNQVAVAFSDAGKVRAKFSSDLGVTFDTGKKLVGAGSLRHPSRAYSADVVGDRIVFEASANKKSGATPQRVESRDGGATWDTSAFGHNGARVGVLLKMSGQTPLLMEAWHNNAKAPKADTLRAKYEQP